MKTYAGTVLGRRQLSAHLVRVTLGGLAGFATTGVPDEYVQVIIPSGVAEPTGRIYTVAGHRSVDGGSEIDLDIALHDGSVGSTWATTCRPGDSVSLTEPHGMYAAPTGVDRQLLVADITGLPAAARIVRGLAVGQRAEVVIVLTDPDDEISLPSHGTVEVTWHVVDGPTDIADALTAAVTSRRLADLYVWLAGEAGASRDVRRHLRRELGWPQSDFYTCGYWQLDAAAKSRRYAEVADEVTERAAAARREIADEGAYLDALDDIFEDLGL
ncbi:MAG: NADPH-dependent ferric siderophore reductase [Aeromicrobium sp.]|nr:NADPH-dependent ferric siderophore reductase [Aeromicrobium sp.]